MRYEKHPSKLKIRVSQKFEPNFVKTSLDVPETSTRTSIHECIEYEV